MFRHLPLALAALAGSAVLFAQEDQIRKSVPVESATKFALDVDFGSIQVEPGPGSTIEIQADFFGRAPSQADADRMKNDFSFNVTHQGNQVRVRGEFRNGWKSFRFGCHIMHESKCLEYTW